MTRDETILVVEDDVALARVITHNLAREGYRVLHAADGEAGLRAACDERPDLVVLDLMLPRLNGYEVLSALREAGLDMQVLVLTARGQEPDKVRGLKLGADQYVTKPVGLAELLARVDAALRRPRAARLAAESRPIEFGEVVADLAARTVRRAGVEVRLTPREFDLLVFLAARPGRPFDRDTLLREVWGLGYEGTARTVDNFVRSLRLKLEPDPDAPVHLVTVHGVGYRFSP